MLAKQIGILISDDKCKKTFFKITFANPDHHFNFLKTWHAYATFSATSPDLKGSLHCF